MQDDVTLDGLRLLLVDDDVELCELLAAFLRDLRSEVQTAHSVAAAMARLDGPPFHLVILDVQLPDGSGFSIASHLRRYEPQTGVVMLTRLAEPSWQVAGFDIGADLYLPKPVSPDLLCAAVRSLASRLFYRQGEMKSNPNLPTLSPPGSWWLADNEWRLYAPDGQWVALNPAERSLVRALFAHARSVVTRKDLLAAMAGGDESFNEHRLDMLVHRLRRKIEANDLPRLPLQSVRGQGYVLMVDPEPSGRRVDERESARSGVAPEASDE